jgi:hypothetical protein
VSRPLGSTLVLGLVLGQLLGSWACVPRQSGDQVEVTPGSEETAALEHRCEALPSAIVLLEPSPSSACGVGLELADRQLTVRSIPRRGGGVTGAVGLGEVLASGPIPDECGDALERCDLWGVHDELGPVLLAVVRGPESEVPVQVYVGWVEDHRLAFVPSWFGLSSVADHTRIGPVWALAPFDCDGGLTLLPYERLPEAAIEEPSEALRVAAGRWTIAADGRPRPSDALPPEPGACRPVFASLP